ncbi:MAG TPA: hypothetical protein VFT16_02960 [Candidatus Saccharimonadales bacterium]|nr:hypothetical protein [Candidatus Saccharimonadales bacterium]
MSNMPKSDFQIPAKLSGMSDIAYAGDKGQTVRSYTDAESLINDYSPHAKRLKRQFPGFPELVSVREELTKLIAKHLF